MLELLLLGLLAAGLGIGWAVSVSRAQQQLARQREEIRRLRELSGGLEAALDSHGRRLDVLLSAVNEVVMRVDRTGRVLAANQQAFDIFGMGSRPALPQSMLLFVRDPDWQNAFAKELRALPEPSPLPDLTMAGRRLAPRLAPLGRDQALLLCLDVTEKYKLEKQRRTFLSNLMHDLKTPLTSLLGYARSLERFGEDEALRREAAQVIADEAKHVNHLLDALLNLDQIEFSAKERSARCRPGEILGQVADMLRSQLESRKIGLEMDQSDLEASMAAADLERVLVNLVENAVRYASEEGQIRVRIDGDERQCRITVEDNGPGIPEKDIPRVTERFYRVDRARSRRQGSHGLGLAIVKELVEAYGGSLSLANVEPHGLLVEVTLPRPLNSQA